MARIAGIKHPGSEHAVIALTSIFGIGRTRAKQLCEAAKVKPDAKVKDLTKPKSRRCASSRPSSRSKAICAAKCP